jgi:hypothetical protein
MRLWRRTDGLLTFDARTTKLMRRLEAFMVKHVIPAEPIFDAQTASGGVPPVIAQLQEKPGSSICGTLFLPAAGGVRRAAAARGHSGPA